jgi:hypothetical protein
MCPYYFHGTGDCMKTMPAFSVLLITLFFMIAAFPVDTLAAGTVALPQTGQSASYATGDDGALNKGVVWPSPRFTNLNGSTPITGSVVLDQLTGLMWTKDGNIPGPVSCTPAAPKYWQEALDFVTCLNSNGYLGYSDWRLPNKREMRSLVNYGEPNNASWLLTQGFTNVMSDRYWTSTSLPGEMSGLAWEIVFPYGETSEYDSYKDGDKIRAWPVRGGHGIYAATADVPQTGQTTCYYTGDDGALRKGASWSSSRFTSPANGAITDNLTGLMWSQDGRPYIADICELPDYITWSEALEHVACLNANSYRGYADWRLPNVNELESLLNSEYGPVTDWLALQGFINLPEPPSYYWSSTSYAYDGDLAWYITMYYGTISAFDKSNSLDFSFSVWPVRETCVETEAKLGGTTYSHIQDAYDALTADNQTIQAQAAIFTENLLMDGPYSVNLRGGYGCGYASKVGWTTINGKMTIKGGRVNIETVAIK